MEERASFSPDAMTGMEANLRFAGPETMETRIFGRLTAWQNWIFNRPNAVGQEGALQRYGTGLRGKFRYGTCVRRPWMLTNGPCATAGSDQQEIEMLDLINVNYDTHDSQ